MNLWVTIRIAARALLRAPMRALLTILGIVIGIGAVLAMVALGEGTKAGIQAQLASLGSNMIMIMPGATSANGVRTTGSSLTAIDAEALASARSLKGVAPTVRGSAQLVAGSRNWSTSIVATTSDYLIVRDWSVAEGVFFGPNEYRSAAKVCVLGATTANELFGEDPAVGQVIRVGNASCEVIGVLAAKGGSAMGQDQDDTLVMPLSTYRARMQPSATGAVNTIIASSSSTDTSLALSEIKAILRQQHRLQSSEEDDFTVRDMQELAQAAGAQADMFSFMLLGIASISLLVGGIGIMNIMLVSVTERTREIGIRMAVGAKGRHILAQFLTESIILALVGGFLGIGLGVGAASLLEGMMGWPTKVSSSMLALAVGVSGGVGIVFGLAPAWTASKLDPIDALRHE